MKTLSLKIPAFIDVRLTSLAKKTKTTKSALVRKALTEYLASQSKIRPGSLLDRVRDLAGCFEGPGDLSTNPKYMEGFGQ
jgi:hypothetical protein